MSTPRDMIRSQHTGAPRQMFPYYQVPIIWQAMPVSSHRPVQHQTISEYQRGMRNQTLIHSTLSENQMYPQHQTSTQWQPPIPQLANRQQVHMCPQTPNLQQSTSLRWLTDLVSSPCQAVMPHQIFHLQETLNLQPYQTSTSAQASSSSQASSGQRTTSLQQTSPPPRPNRTAASNQMFLSCQSPTPIHTRCPALARHSCPSRYSTCSRPPASNRESDSEEETQTENSKEQQKQAFRGLKNFCHSLSRQQRPTGKSGLAKRGFLLLHTGDPVMNRIS